MVRSRERHFWDYDWLSILLFLLLAGFGIIMIAMVDRYHFPDTDFWHSHAGKQSLWLMVSLVFAGLIALTQHRFFMRWSSVFYLVTLLLLALVLVAGHKVSGARSWFRVGGFGFQPAETAKWMVSLGLAKLLTDRNFSINRIVDFLKVLMLIGIPVGLILLQPDMGTVLVFVAAFTIVLYRFGLKAQILLPLLWAVFLFFLSVRYDYRFVMLAVGLLTLLVALMIWIWVGKRQRMRLLLWVVIAGGLSMLWTRAGIFGFRQVLKPHQQQRIEIMLGKLKDEKGAGYHLRQSLIAIANGGVEGRGLGRGSQLQGRFIPEQHTDYIFTAIAEQFGFIGAGIFMMLYVIFIIRLYFLAERQKNGFAAVFGYGLAAFLTVHLFLNVLMTMGLFPTVGIPIPFVSYGGSSLWNFVIFLFLFLHFDAARGEYLA